MSIKVLDSAFAEAHIRFAVVFGCAVIKGTLYGQWKTDRAAVVQDGQKTEGHYVHRLQQHLTLLTLPRFPERRAISGLKTTICPFLFDFLLEQLRLLRKKEQLKLSNQEGRHL